MRFLFVHKSVIIQMVITMRMTMCDLLKECFRAESEIIGILVEIYINYALLNKQKKLCYIFFYIYYFNILNPPKKKSL